MTYGFKRYLYGANSYYNEIFLFENPYRRAIVLQFRFQKVVCLIVVCLNDTASYGNVIIRATSLLET